MGLRAFYKNLQAMKLLPLKTVSAFLNNIPKTEKENLAVKLINKLHYPELPLNELISNALDDWYTGKGSIAQTYKSLKSALSRF